MKKISLLSCFIFIFALSGCDHEVKEEQPLNQSPVEMTEQPREYYRDTITLYIPSETNPEFLALDLNRREFQEQGNFQHYYFLDYHNGTDTVTDSMNLMAKDKAPQTNGFLTAWENKLFEDLSARESYNFSVTIKDEKYEVQLTDMQADFLTKNTPEYTRYTSVGKATVIKNGKVLSAYAVLEKAYSSDDSLYVYFEGYEKLESETNSMHLWDENGNYYYIDKTHVLSDQPGYQSHTWLLKKNLNTKLLQKAFSAEVDFSKSDKYWKISMPDFGDTFELSTRSEFNLNPISGPVTGTVVNSEGETKKVNGWFSTYGL